MKKHIFDISDFVGVVTQETIIENLVERAIRRRKELKISQKEMAKQSGVSYGSIRRFESTGQISLESLMKIARVINSLEDFNLLFKTPQIIDIEDYKV